MYRYNWSKNSTSVVSPKKCNDHSDLSLLDTFGKNSCIAVFMGAYKHKSPAFARAVFAIYRATPQKNRQLPIAVTNYIDMIVVTGTETEVLEFHDKPACLGCQVSELTLQQLARMYADIVCPEAKCEFIFPLCDAAEIAHSLPAFSDKPPKEKAPSQIGD